MKLRVKIWLALILLHLILALFGLWLRDILIVKVTTKFDLLENIVQTSLNLCKSNLFLPASTKASIIIVTHNEEQSVLRTTLDSIIQSTPVNYVEEIIIIDDESAQPVLYRALDSSIRVKIHRNTVREGLIRSRVIGARLALGDALVFMDSHILLLQNWLEPLLSRLCLHKSEQSKLRSDIPTFLVLSPVIDDFVSDGAIFPASEWLRGGFDWDLTFVWEHHSETEKEGIGKDWSQYLDVNNNLTLRLRPRAVPVIAGCVIAMLREDFFKAGAFDEGMDIWGSENIELSLRTWMCGGRVEIVPCSRVAHRFRTNDFSYKFPGGKVATITRNMKRVATVWMHPVNEDILLPNGILVPPIALFYSARAETLRTSTGNITSRLRLKHRMKCHDFSWFLRNVYPDLLNKAATVRLSDAAVLAAKLSNFYIHA